MGQLLQLAELHTSGRAELIGLNALVHIPKLVDSPPNTEDESSCLSCLAVVLALPLE